MKAEVKTTFCRICEPYCGLRATVEGGAVVGLAPDDEHVVSRGFACKKGLQAHRVTHDPERITTPMRRTSRGWEKASWDEVLPEIAGKLTAIRKQHGPHALGIYFGNPSGLYYAHRMALMGWKDAVGTRNAFGAGSVDNLAIFVACQLLYGSPLALPIPDLERVQHLLLVGANPVVSHWALVNAHRPIALLHEVRRRGGKIVVLDPRRSETARIADRHVFVRPDRDLYLLLAMIRAILVEGWADESFLQRWSTGLEQLRAAVDWFTPERAEEQAGVPAAQVRELAREFAQAPGACAYGRPTTGRFGTLTCWAIQVLNVITGNLDRAGGAIFGDALVEVAAANARLGLSTYGKVRSRIGGHPDVMGELPSGLLADEIETPGPGQIRGLIVDSGNPVVSLSNGPRLATALGRLDCLVAIDFYLNETTSLAHYFLPATSFFEREDFPLMHVALQVQPYAQWTEAVVPPVGDARPEWDIYLQLSQAMGLPLLNSRLFSALYRVSRWLGRPLGPRQLLDLVIRTGPMGDRFLPGSKGLNLRKIARHQHGLALSAQRTGVIKRRLLTRDRKVHLFCPEMAQEIERARREAAAPLGAQELLLIGRRDPLSHNSWMHNVPTLMDRGRCRRLRISADDARSRQLENGARARVTTAVGELEVEILISDELMPGVVSLPHGWSEDRQTPRTTVVAHPGPNYNALTDHKQIEPLAGMSFLNGVPVRLEPVAS